MRNYHMLDWKATATTNEQRILHIRGVAIPLFTGSKSRFRIAKRLKIWLQIRIKAQNHNTLIDVTILLCN